MTAVGNPLVTFGDPQDATIDYLTALVAALDPVPDYLADSAGAAITVSARFPDGQTGAPSVPHLQVRYDGTPALLYPVLEQATIGVVAWYDPGRKSDARKAATLASGWMATHRGDDRIWRILPLSGRLPGIDPDSQLYFVGATFRVSTKPTAP